MERIALWTLLAVALLSVPAYLTGSKAEHQIEHGPGITEHDIEEHEESALPSLIATALAGLVAVAGLAMGRGARPMPPWAPVLALAIGVVATLLLVRTANLGGLIRHPEIQENGTAAPGGGAPGDSD